MERENLYYSLLIVEKSLNNCLRLLRDGRSLTDLPLQDRLVLVSALQSHLYKQLLDEISKKPTS